MNSRLKRLLVCTAVGTVLFCNQPKAEPLSVNEQVVQEDDNEDEILEIVYDKIANGETYITISNDDSLDIRPDIDVSIVIPEVTEEYSEKSSQSNEVISSKNLGVGQKIAQFALSLVGKPYSYGSTGSNSFDCSGLAVYVFRNFGIELPRTSQSQAYVGTRVSKSDLQPGDLVFSNTYSSLSHVGVYVGDGKFVHAANYNTGVTVSSINDSYYGPRYAWSTRVY